MSLARLYYLTCDTCGAPAGGTDDLAATAKEARQVSIALGWYRHKTQDYCPTCLAAHHPDLPPALASPT